VFSFLVNVDPTLKGLLSSYAAGDKDARELLMPQIRDRCVTLLGALFPNAGVAAAPEGSNSKDNIMFGGVEYDLMKYGANSTASIDQSNVASILQFKKVNEDSRAGDPVTQNLSQVSGITLSADEIKDKARADGVDLANPPLIPNGNLFKFLYDIDPQLKDLM